jgi:hypothetical protein
MREWNEEMQAERRIYRKSYLDMNTMVSVATPMNPHTHAQIVQYPKHCFATAPADQTRPGAYPVALIPDHYVNTVPSYTPTQLRQLPLNTVTDNEHIVLPKRPRAPMPIRVSEDEMKVCASRTRHIRTLDAHDPVCKRRCSGGGNGGGRVGRLATRSGTVFSM